jgi:hypothetical protein
MLLSDKTKFVFIVTSKKQTEDRFFFDVQYFVDIIKTKQKDIDIIANEDRADICAKCPNLDIANFVKPENAISHISSCNCENLFIIVNCHGGLQSLGIDSTVPLQSIPFTEAIKSSSATNIIVLFCQCYAGIYSYVDISHNDKSIVYIGSTGMRPSLSASICGIPWAANITLISMAYWMNSPLDIDGDGKFSIADMYMFVSALTNDIVHQLNKNHSMTLKTVIDKAVLSSKLDLEKEIFERAIKDYTEQEIPRQSPWIITNTSLSNLIIEDLK